LSYLPRRASNHTTFYAELVFNRSSEISTLFNKESPKFLDVETLEYNGEAVDDYEMVSDDYIVSTVCVILVRSTLDSCSVIGDTAVKADLIVLNTAVARKWLDAVLKEDVGKALLHKIHEMIGRIILNKSWLRTYAMYMASMEDGEEEISSRLEAIFTYTCVFNTRNSWQEETKTDKAYLEDLKIALEETEDELNYFTTTHAELVGEVVQPLGKERYHSLIYTVLISVLVKVNEGVRLIVNRSSLVNQSKLVSGTRNVYYNENPLVHKMVCQHHGGDVSYSDLGGLTHQLRDVRDWIERPLIDPDIFERVGVKPPKGVLLYGPPGTGKTLLAKAISSNINSTFLIKSFSLVSKYVGESPLMVREMFKYAPEHQPCIIFLDEIDAIDRRRSCYGEGETKECDRVLIELLSELDGFNELDKVIMATNRPDVLDPALLRPGRIDKKIEFSLPNEDSRIRILKIHASGITKQGDIDYEKVVKLSEGFNGADMRNVCTEAGMLALRAGHDYVVPSDFIKAVTKLGEAKKLESNGVEPLLYFSFAWMESPNSKLFSVHASMEDVDEEIVRRINDEKVKRGIAIMRCQSKLHIRNINQERTKTVKENLEALKIRLEETEDELKYFTTTNAELVGEVMQPLGKERFLVKVNEGVRYIVNRSSLAAHSKLVSGTRVNPFVQKMVYQHDGGDVSYSDLGGLTHQLKDVRDWIERPLIDPDIFERVGVKPPKGVLLYGPPGTGKTLLAKAISSNINSTFLMVVSSSLVSKYVGESSLLVREMFKYAREHQPCIIFMDEIDAIGRRRSSYGEGDTSECDRVLIELLSQLDGFNELDKVTVIMATNRPDVLDPALLRPGRIDKKIEFSLPNEDSRMRIIKIHASGITKQGDIDYEKVVKLSEGFSGADMRNICTEAGMLALRAGHDYVVPNDFIKAVTKLGEAKKLESSAHYSAGF
ncbi:hypothetical protein HID58_047474, partial [Brassica napus]